MPFARVTPSWPRRSFASTNNPSNSRTEDRKGDQSHSSSGSGEGNSGGSDHSSSSSRPSLLSMAGMKELARKYGKVATLVYFGVSMIDLSACVWIVRAAGETKVKQVEDWVVEHLGNWALVGRNPQQVFNEARGHSVAEDGNNNAIEPSSTVAASSDASADQSAAPTDSGPSWTSTFVIAYSIHKLLVPIRVPITVLITPSIAARLRRMGYFLPKK
ncbi:DUF1279 super [Dimargaris verticillata]|uniref:DUF1279 super n=1 Tax=Dimargaris verticillata TaxID=2761393 RepID=A0A9W8B3K3_9FUNG|nr:DUF1279 super [Dimargaris verticillata]